MNRLEFLKGIGSFALFPSLELNEEERIIKYRVNCINGEFVNLYLTEIEVKDKQNSTFHLKFTPNKNNLIIFNNKGDFYKIKKLIDYYRSSFNVDSKKENLFIYNCNKKVGFILCIWCFNDFKTFKNDLIEISNKYGKKV